MNIRAVVLFIAILNPQISSLFAQETTNYSIDKGKSLLKWQATKVTGAHNGLVKVKNGHVLMKDGAVIGGTIYIDMTTISNLDIKDPESKKDLETHLKSDDFFGTQKNPVAFFKIYKLKALEGDERFTHTVEGSLTIKGYTHPLVFPMKVEIKNQKVFLSGSTEVDRTLYNIKYGSGKFFEDLGDKMIYDMFTIDFSIAANAPKK